MPVINEMSSMRMTTICNQEVVSNKFNNHFVNITQNLLRNSDESKNKFQDYLKDPNTQSFFS